MIYLVNTTLRVVTVMTLSTQPYINASAFYPETKRAQKYLFRAMQRITEQFGYEEYDTPTLEVIDLYRTQNGEELTEAIYSFTDHNGTRVALRPDVTPAVSRLVAGKRDSLTFPLRWYTISDTWRTALPQAVHEQRQLHIDLFGLKELIAEVEIVQLMNTMLHTLGATQDAFTIKVSSRRLMDYIFNEYLGLSRVQATTIAELIARLHTMSIETFIGELDILFTPSQREAGVHNKLIGLLKTKDIAHLPEAVRDHEATTELKELIQRLRDLRLTNVVFDLSVMPELTHYTGVVFAISESTPELSSPLMSGGRYDALVGQFGVQPLPAIGATVHESALRHFLEHRGLMPKLNSETDMGIIIPNDFYGRAQRVIQDIREMGVNVAVDISDAPLESQLKHATQKGWRYVLCLTEKDMADEQYEIRNLYTNTTARHGLARIVSIVKDYRDTDED